MLAEIEGLFKKIVDFFRSIRPEYFSVKRLWALFLFFLLGNGLFTLAVYGNWFNLFGSIPPVSQILKSDLDVSSEIYSNDDKLLGKFYKYNRSATTLDSISPFVEQALLSAEDIRFYYHSGLDAVALFAIPYYLIQGDNRGGSTITQQLAKNFYSIRTGNLGVMEKMPLFRMLTIKIKEWITAIRIERFFAKREILQLYLNTVDFGNNAYGIKIASKLYFNKKPIDLTCEEAATLIGILKATSKYNPLINAKNSVHRRNVVLSQMEKYGYLTAEKADSLRKLPLALNPTQALPPDGVQDYYGPNLKNEIEAICRRLKLDPYSDGLKIKITIDTRIQDSARKAVAEEMADLQQRFYNHIEARNDVICLNKKNQPITDFIERQIKKSLRFKRMFEETEDEAEALKKLQKPERIKLFSWNGIIDTVISPIDSIIYSSKFLHAALLSIEPQSGEIRAWIGGNSFRFFQYDHVKLAKRQPGSTFKPFTYAAAIDKGFSPCFKIKDTVYTIVYKEKENGEIKTKWWTPHNSDWKYTGLDMSLRHGMGRSVNSVTVKLSDMVGGWRTVHEYARRMGVVSRLDTFPSVVLGSSEVSLYEMVGAYCTFVNQGVWQEPTLIKEIRNKYGEIIYIPNQKSLKAISPEAAYLMLHMFKGSLQEPKGTSAGLFRYRWYLKTHVGGKTGTSSDYADGWFIGMSPDLVTGVWVGADEPCVRFKNNQGEGGHTALPIFGRLYEKMYYDTSLKLPGGDFARPSVNITRNYYCPTILPKDSLPADTLVTDSVITN